MCSSRLVPVSVPARTNPGDKAKLLLQALITMYCMTGQSVGASYNYNQCIGLSCIPNLSRSVLSTWPHPIPTKVE